MSIHTLKQIVSVIAVILTFLAYVPYYRDIMRGKTHPHIYSWLLWGLLGILIVSLQLVGNAGPAVLVTASASIMCIGVIILGLKHGKRDITASDTVVAILSVIAMIFWLLARQPIISIFLVVIADLLAFVPTIRKSWHKPHTETLALYATNTVRFGLAVFAIREYSLLSTLWPAAWVVANGSFAVMLIIRRRQLGT